MDYLDKALSMLDTPAFEKFSKGEITWEQYVEIRNGAPSKRVPTKPVLIYSSDKEN